MKDMERHLKIHTGKLHHIDLLSAPGAEDPDKSDMWCDPEPFWLSWEQKDVLNKRDAVSTRNFGRKCLEQ